VELADGGWFLREEAGPNLSRHVRARHASLREVGRILSSFRGFAANTLSPSTVAFQGCCESGVTSCLVRHDVRDNGDNDGESSMLN